MSKHVFKTSSKEFGAIDVVVEWVSEQETYIYSVVTSDEIIFQRDSNIVASEPGTAFLDRCLMALAQIGVILPHQMVNELQNDRETGGADHTVIHQIDELGTYIRCIER